MRVFGFFGFFFLFLCGISIEEGKRCEGEVVDAHIENDVSLLPCKMTVASMLHLILQARQRAKRHNFS